MIVIDERDADDSLQIAQEPQRDHVDVITYCQRSLNRDEVLENTEQQQRHSRSNISNHQVTDDARAVELLVDFDAGAVLDWVCLAYSTAACTSRRAEVRHLIQ